MANELVKQIINDDGEPVPKKYQRWHLLSSTSGDVGMLCTGEFVGHGCDSGNGCEYIHKVVKRGGITCDKCMEILMEFKSVKL